MWGSDTGSFDDNPGRELYLRWIEFSTYSTMMEFKIEGKDQWYYGENRDQEVIDLTSKATQIHHELVPYTRSALYHAHQTGVPVMRAMMLEAPSDPTVADMWDQFYYGPNLLVAPVSREGVQEREVYLPAGRWLNYNDRSTVEQGGQTVTAPAPLGTVPRFVPEGAILPRGNILEANQRWLDDWRPALRIEVYPARSETTSFDYYTGEAVRTITSSASDEAIEISFDALDHDGQLEVYAENVTEVERNGEILSEDEYEYNAEQNVLTVSFSGATTLRLPGASSIF
jgi:alpha-glucosidase (family GH31 glycosyl hydrolase)